MLEGFGHRVGAGRPTLLAFHHRQRDAVHEQHDVRNDELLHAARRVDAELVDRQEVIVLRPVEINQPHHRVLLPGQFIHVHLGLEQQLLHCLISLQQRFLGLTQNLILQILQLTLGQPGLTVRGFVQFSDGTGKHLRQNPLAEVLTQAPRWIGGDVLTLVDDLPAQLFKLGQEGLFDFGVFRHSQPHSRASPQPFR